MRFPCKAERPGARRGKETDGPSSLAGRTRQDKGRIWRKPAMPGIFLVFGVVVSMASGSCGPSEKHHELDWTGGQVRFARSSRDFYAARWRTRFRSSDRRICAGFVHKEKFGRYLAYGHFDLRMKLEVFKGGTSKHDASGRLVDWQGGKLLRTLVKKRPAHETQDAYVWCGSLRKGARWKVGAMRYTFWLHRDDPPKDIFLAKGIVEVLP